MEPEISRPVGRRGEFLAVAGADNRMALRVCSCLRKYFILRELQIFT
jgi:hypothetical protein